MSKISDQFQRFLSNYLAALQYRQAMEDRARRMGFYGILGRSMRPQRRGMMVPGTVPAATLPRLRLGQGIDMQQTTPGTFQPKFQPYSPQATGRPFLPQTPQVRQYNLQPDFAQAYRTAFTAYPDIAAREMPGGMGLMMPGEEPEIEQWGTIAGEGGAPMLTGFGPRGKIIEQYEEYVPKGKVSRPTKPTGYTIKKGGKEIRHDFFWDESKGIWIDKVVGEGEIPLGKPDYAHDPELQRLKDAQKAINRIVADLKKEKKGGTNQFGFTFPSATPERAKEIDLEIQSAQSDSSNIALRVDARKYQLESGTQDFNWSAPSPDPRYKTMEEYYQAILSENGEKDNADNREYFVSKMLELQEK